MIPLDYQNKAFQEFMTGELNLSDRAAFTSCNIFRGSPFQDRCIGIIQDRGMTNILLSGTYEISGTTTILNVELPGAPDPRVPLKEIDKAGLRRETTRLVGVCARKPGSEGPEIQIIIIPY